MKRFIPNIKYFLFAIILVSLFIPMLQQISPQTEEVPLMGKVVPAKDVEFSWDLWYSGRYQKMKGDYLKENFGYRTDFVRLYNEVQYSIYGKFSAPNIYEGKNNYLFRFYHHDYNFQFNFKGLNYYLDKKNKLEAITKKLEEQGVTLIFAINPGKHAFHRDQLPERNRKGINSDSTNYKCFQTAFTGSDVNWIDMNEYFEKRRNSLDYPLYAKGGIHWTRMGCFEGMREIMKFASDVKGADYPVIQWTDPRVFTWIIDTDITNTINLLRNWNEHEDIKFADLIPPNDSLEKPNVLIVSDSYFDAPYWSRVPETYFTDEYKYWYYNKMSFDSKYGGTQINKKDIVSETKDRDVIVIMSTVMNLENVGWGFIEDVYNAEFPEKE